MSDQSREQNRSAQSRWRISHQEQRRAAAKVYHARRREELRQIRRECGRGAENRNIGRNTA